MKRFNPDSRCPKCGRPGAAAVYHPRLLSHGAQWPCTKQPDAHMCRRCRTCGCAWQEVPLDAWAKDGGPL